MVMKALKIAVYGIAKNEESVAARWAASAAEADVRIVLDTGSTDRTVEVLRTSGVEVHSATVSPWRFDEARNRSLDLVPADVDICISLDLDEVLSPGWRQEILKAWIPGTTMIRYPFITAFHKDGRPSQVTWGHKVHKRDGYRWQYAIHEILRPLAEHQEVFTQGFKIEHIETKERSNDRYIDIIRQWSILEPQEPRYQQYLARNLFDQGKYQECLAILEKYFNLPNLDTPEKAFSYRIQAWCYRQLNASPDFIVESLLKAVAFAPRERETWAHLAEEMYFLGNIPNAYSALTNALRIKESYHSYRMEPDVWSGKLEMMMDKVIVELKRSL